MITVGNCTRVTVYKKYSIMNHLSNSNLIAAALGLTVGVLSAASIFIYHKILENQQQTIVTDLDVASKKIAELQAELDALRIQQSQQKKKRKASRKFSSNDSTYTITDNDKDIDTFSTADTDIGDEEFYDCSDSESIVGENDIRRKRLYVQQYRVSEELNQLDLELNDIDEHANEEFDIKTYYKLQTLVKSDLDNVEVVWRFARTCYDHAEATADTNKRRMIILEGIEQCERILEIENGNLYKWYAILIGLNGDYLSIAERIKNGVRFKNYVLRALEIQQDDFELHHLLGRFYFGIASLSWIEKKVAATLFSAPLSASYEEALDCFETSAKLGSTNLQNQLFIGKCCIALKQYPRAINALEEILKQPIEASGQEKVHAEASELLRKYSGYRS